MLSLVVGLVGGLVLAGLQAGFFSALLVWGVVPNLVLVCALSLHFLGAHRSGAWLVFFGGLLLDSLFSGHLGALTLSLTLLLFVFSLAQRFLGQNLVFFIVSIFLVSFLFALVRSYFQVSLSLALKEGLLSLGFLAFIYPVLRVLVTQFARKNYIQLKMNY